MGVFSSAVQMSVGKDHVSHQLDHGLSRRGEMLYDLDASIPDAAVLLSVFIRAVNRLAPSGFSAKITPMVFVQCRLTLHKKCTFGSAYVIKGASLVFP